MTTSLCYNVNFQSRVLNLDSPLKTFAYNDTLVYIVMDTDEWVVPL